MSKKLANAQRELENFEPKFLYNVSSASQEENEVNMTRKKLCSLKDGAEDKKKCAEFVKRWLSNLHLFGISDVKVVKCCH